MNKFAHKTSTFLVRVFSELSKSRVHIDGEENIPNGSIIFVANHFTRFETLLLPSYISLLTQKNIWGIADKDLFTGALKLFLDMLGAVSTENPDKNLLMTKTLITGENHWIIFPEGLMVKNKKILEKDGSFIIFGDEGITSPHTGAAVFAIRCEFYRRRLKKMLSKNSIEANRIKKLFEIENASDVINKETFIVPLNLSYYPIDINKNFLNSFIEKSKKLSSARLQEEVASEISLFFSDVDINIRFGKPINIKDCFNDSFIESDLSSKRAIDFDSYITSRSIIKNYATEITRKYMAAIYSLTTINYGHIFSLILKYVAINEINEISENNFKRLAFLVISKIIPKIKKYFFHTHLERNQINILFNQSHKEYDHFINIALNSKVIELKNNIIKIDKKRLLDETLNTFEDFHSIRLNNTFAVILNEIEILKDTEYFFKKFIQDIKKKHRESVKEFLYNKALTDFTNDYNKYYIKDESKEKIIGTPYLLQKEKNNGIGILLIHGYMAGPYEVKNFAQYLKKKGFIVFVPRLKGHGTSPEDLSIRTYEDWLLNVKEGFVFLNQFCKKIFVGGFSLGGVLALYLQTMLKGCSGVFAISPPIKIKNFASNFVPAVNLWNKLIKKASLNKLAKDFTLNEPEHKHINYKRNPLSALEELETVVKKLNENIEKIKIPTLIIQSHKDPVVDYKATFKMFESLKTEKKEFVLFDISKHGILIGEDAEKVYKIIYDFLLSN